MADASKKTKKKIANRIGNDPFQHVRSTVGESGEEIIQRGRPRTNMRQITSKSQLGVPEGWTRYTLIVREDILVFLRDLAYWDRLKVKDVVDQALETHFKKHHKRLEALKKGDATSAAP